MTLPITGVKMLSKIFTIRMGFINLLVIYFSIMALKVTFLEFLTGLTGTYWSALQMQNYVIQNTPKLGFK